MNLFLGCFFIVVYNMHMYTRLDKKYLIIIIIIIFVVNIGIFLVFAKQLEIYVINNIVDNNVVLVK